MARYATGKHAKFISDRSGMAFPYSERVKEWNGSLVHLSEFDAKHPQLRPRKSPLEPQSLYQPRIPRKEPMVVYVAESVFGAEGSLHGTGQVGVVTVTTS